jgi:hypothetical protein
MLEAITFRQAVPADAAGLRELRIEALANRPKPLPPTMPPPWPIRPKSGRISSPI